MSANVAIIGAGPGGLVAARYLQDHGFVCTILEQSGDVGGQWNARSTHSGVWPAMRTNTSRVLTCFSDLRHEPGIATYPTNQEILAYLKRYAAHFDLLQDLRLETRVEALRPAGQGYAIRAMSPHGASFEQIFDYVIVASGRYNHPVTPQIAGLNSFCGSGGVIHAFRYKAPERYRGLRVLVAGCAISALEIASDLAMLGAARVTCTYRRQRYVLPKLFAGIPTDHVAFTRFNALCSESLSPNVVAGNLKQFALRANGSPEQSGAFKPAEDVAEAGITLSQYFLALLAEGRITLKPWISAVNGMRVVFADGTHGDFDAIIFATGYGFSLPFLSDAVRRTLALDCEHIDLYNFTFHPDLPGMAFLGMHDQVGPFFPVLELQARWIAYLWAGLAKPATQAESADGLVRCRARREQPQKTLMHDMAILFARAAGVEPSPEEYPSLARALLFGPLSPSSFRLTGPDRLPQAADWCREDAAAFGAVTSPDFRPEESAQLELLKKSRLNRDRVFSQAVAQAFDR